MAAFSWQKAILHADKHILRQAKIQAIKGTQQAKLDHPNEVQDASRSVPDFTQLTLRIKKELQTKRLAVLKYKELLGNQQT